MGSTMFKKKKGGGKMTKPPNQTRTSLLLGWVRRREKGEAQAGSPAVPDDGVSSHRQRTNGERGQPEPPVWSETNGLEHQRWPPAHSSR